MDLHSAIQHARCSAAVTVLIPFLDPSCWSEEKERIGRIDGWAHQCAEALGKKTLGSRGTRLRDKVYAELVRYIDAHRSPDRLVRDITTATALVSAIHLTAEAKITCPTWAHGRAWYNLDRMLFALLREVVAAYPQAEQDGVALYERFGAVFDCEAA